MKSPTHLLSVLVPAMMLAMMSCAVKADRPMPVYENPGHLFVYLSGSEDPSADITFTLSSLRFMDQDGSWYEAPIESRSVNSLALAGAQTRLSELYLPQGTYVKCQMFISNAVHLRDHQRVPLSVREIADDSQPIPVDTVIEVELKYRQSACLFIDWDADRSIDEEFRFHPYLSATTRNLEISNILAYVTNEASDCVTVIDKQKGAVVGTIAVGKAPRGIVALTNGARLYVANSGSKDISVIDTTVNRVVTTIDNFGYAPQELALYEDDHILYATNPQAGTVSVIDMASGRVANRIKVGRRPVGLAVDPQRRKLYVSNADSYTLSVIDMEEQRVENTLTVSDAPRFLTVCDERLYVGNQRGTYAFVFEIPSYIERRITNVGSGPERITCGLSNRVYVANSIGNQVSIFHTALDMVTREIRVGRAPAAMAVDALRRKLYVVNRGSDNVSVIDITSERVDKTIEVGRNPYGIALIEE